MTRRSQTVIKRQQVRAGPPYPLGGGAGGSGPRRRPAQARVVQESPQGVVLEVVCPCGERILLECGLDAAAGADAPPAAG